MKTTIITEFVKIEALQTTTDEQLLAKADLINDFLQKQDGFIDSELVKALEGNTWYFLYHIENMEKLRVVGEKLRSSKLFDELTPLTVAGSMSVSFFGQIKRW
jgi:superfamily I DNA and/or RNA helicase